jgi:acetate kinase
LDGIVFTAGIGERAPSIRAAVCARLEWLGVVLDQAANERNAPVISTAASAVEVRVVPTDEQSVIAHHALETLRRPR